MNKDRRKRLTAMIDKLADIQELIVDVSSEIDDVRDEEENAWYSLPESLQGSERGEQMQANVEIMQEVIDDLEIDLEDIAEKLWDAINA